MSTGHPPHHRQHDRDEFRESEQARDDRSSQIPVHGDRSLRRDAEYLAALSPLLEEAAGLQSQRQEAGDLLLLLEENARLRKLAVKLSNLLGDLPATTAGEIEPGSSNSRP